MYKILSKERKKALCLLLVVVFSLLMVLTGCGSAKDNGSAATAESQTTVSGSTEASGTAKSELPPVELTWYMRGNGAEPDGQKVYDEASKYLKPLINASIKVVCFDRGSYVQKVTSSIASGETFDMCFTAVYAVNYVENAQKGAFVPLNDPKNNLFEKYAPKTLEILGADFLAGSAIDGINYAIPVNKEKAHSYGYALRKDLVDKYKFDISTVKTLEDLEPMLKTIKENEPTMPYPISECTRDNSAVILDWQRSSINDNLPVAMYGDNRDKVFRNILETPEEMAYFKVIRRFYQEGLVRKDAPTISDYTPDLQANKIFAKELVTKPGGDAEMSAQYGTPWVQIEMSKPAMTNGETMGAMSAISRTSKNPERSMMFLELMNTDKYLNNLINFGIENVHYVKVNENTIDYLPDSDNGKKSGYNPQYSWGFANQFINYLFPNEDPNKWKNFEAYNESAIRTHTLGFLMNQEPVKTEIAACMNVAAEYMPGLETGASDPEKIVPQAIAKLKDAGIDRVIAEAQKQFNEWDAKQK